MDFYQIASFTLLSFTSVFFIVNPLSAAPIFLALTEGMPHEDRVRVVKRAVLIAAVALITFTLTGSLIFKMFSITIGAFRVAGGILLMRVAMDMLHGRPSHTKSTPDDHKEAQDKQDIAITPLGVPQLAGPGSLATVMLLPGEPREWWRIGPVILAILLTCLITFLILRGAERVQRFIGQSGTRIMTKIMGLLIAAVAVQFVTYGIQDLLPVIMQKISH